MFKEQLRKSAMDKFVAYTKKYTSLDEKELREMLDHIPMSFFSKGTILIRQGEVPEKCFFILEGCARKYSVDEEGREVTSDFMTENQTIAIFSPVDREGSPYSVSCLEDSIMVVGNLAEIEDENKRYPEFAEISQKIVEENMGSLQDEFASFIRLTPEERVKRMINMRPELFERVPQYQLASYLGITAESLSRIKRRLEYEDLKLVD